MAISTQTTEPNPRLTWFVKPLGAIASRFAAHVPGEPVDTSLARPTPLV